MSIVEIGALIAAVTGFVTGVFGLWRSWQADKNSAQASKDAAMVTNFQKLYDEQGGQITDLKEEIKRIKNDQSEERKQWASERQEMQTQIRELTKSNNDKDVTIAELRGELKGLSVKVDKQEKEPK